MMWFILLVRLVVGERGTINDFEEDDFLLFNKNIFNKLDADSADNFVLSTEVQDADDYLVYNSTKGLLYYDADGIGGATGIQIILIKGSAKATLSYDDILLYG